MYVQSDFLPRRSNVGQSRHVRRFGRLQVVCLFLCALVGLAGAESSHAQTPEPSETEIPAAIVAIDALRRDADADNRLDRLGEHIRVTGRVTVGATHDLTEKRFAYVQDGSAGVRLESRQPNFSLAVGDSVVASGRLVQDSLRTWLDVDEYHLIRTRPGEPAVQPLNSDLIYLEGWAGQLVQFEGRVVGKGRDQRGPYLVVNRPGGPVLVRLDAEMLESVLMGDDVRVSGVLDLMPLGGAGSASYRLYTRRADDLARLLWTKAHLPWAIAGGIGVLALLMLALCRRGATSMGRRAARFHALFQRAPVAGILADHELKIVEANASAWQLMGRAGLDLSRQNLRELIETEQDLTPATLWGALRRAGVLTFAAHTTRNGDPVELEVTMKPFESRGKDHVMMVLYDVSGLKEEAALTRNFYHTLLTDVPIDVAVLTPQGEYSYVGPRSVGTKEMRQWLLGRTDVDLCQKLGLHPEIALRRRAHRKRAVNSGEAVSFEESIPLADGSTVHLMRSYSPVLDPQGEVSMIISYSLDVTDSKECRAELEVARQQVEEMAHLKEIILDNISHEFRTPLTGIIGSAQILVEEVTDEQREFLQIIERNGRRLMSTLTAILDLAGLHAETIQTAPRVFDMVDEVRNVASSLQPLVEEKELFLRLNAIKGEILVRLDQACLYRVLQSLMENAVKFTESGGVVVELDADQTNAYVRIIDSGIGMQGEFLPILYDEFKQESLGINRSYEGVGLGLAITKRLIDLMHGVISVDTEKGEGTVFTISFPRAFALSNGRLGLRPNVLLAESNPEMRVLIQYMLDTHFQLEQVGDLAQLLDAVEQVQFDLILLDVGLDSGLDSADVLAAVREIKGYGTVPVVALDQAAMPGGQEQFRIAGFDGYLSKPFKRPALLNVLGDVLETRQGVSIQRAG